MKAQGETPAALALDNLPEDASPARRSAGGADIPIVPDHTLLRQIGQGSYGGVWLARNTLGTLRAVKIVRRAEFDDDRPYEREFAGLQKFEPVSRAHEGFVDLLQVGRNDSAGYFYCVMELADDLNERRETVGPAAAYVPHTLSAEVKRRGVLQLDECVAIAATLASALGELHRHGLVHRDIKPSNIIFVNSVPKLADIGLVAAANEARSFVGTEGFIAPEGPGTPRADLYSFGIVLYVISTGKNHRDFPEPPTNLGSRPDHVRWLELQAIIHRACATDPTERYLDAEAMRADLELLRDGGSVRRSHGIEKNRRMARRAIGWLALITILITLIALAVRLRPVTGPRTEKLSTNEVANRFYKLARVQSGLTSGTNIQMAVESFERATQEDPRFAQAWAWLAATYMHSDTIWNPDWILRPKAKEAALRAVNLDNGIANAHSVLGFCKILDEWAWAEAEAEYKLAIRLDPYSSDSHNSYAEFLKMFGKPEQALEEMNAADRLDPRSEWTSSRVVALLIAARKFDKAIQQADLVIEMAGNRKAGMYSQRASAQCALNKYPEAIASEKARELANGEPSDLIEREYQDLLRAYDAEGRIAYWKWSLDRSRKEGHGPFFEACEFAQMGNTNEAIACLQKALKDRDVWLTFRVMTDWTLDPVRSDPRFREILHAMHLESPRLPNGH